MRRRDEVASAADDGASAPAISLGTESPVIVAAAAAIQRRFPEIFAAPAQPITEIRKADLVMALFEICWDLVDLRVIPRAELIDLDRTDISAAVARNSLPLGAVSHLCRFASDPSALEFSACYDQRLHDAIIFEVLMAADGAPALPTPLRVVLLAAGLLKFSGRFGAARSVYDALTSAPGAAAQAMGLIGLADIEQLLALWGAHLSADERAEVSVTACYGLPDLLAATLRCEVMPPASLEGAVSLYRRAAQLAPGLPMAQYGLARCYEAMGEQRRARRRYGLARELMAREGPAWQALTLLMARLQNALEPLDVRGHGEDGGGVSPWASLPPGTSETCTSEIWLQLTEVATDDARSGRPDRTYCNIIPAKQISYRYHIYDGQATRTIVRETLSRELSSFRAENIRLLGPAAAPVALADTYLLKETRLFSGREREIWDPCLVACAGERALYAVEREAPLVQEDVIVLPGLGGFYFHFLFDVIGALAVVPSSEWADRKFMFSQAPLAQHGLLPWQREVLSMIGISPAKVLPYPPDCRSVRVQRGIVCSFPSQDNAVTPAVVGFLRRRLLQAEHPIRAGKRVFFTRSNTRRLDHDSAGQLSDLAIAHGFSVFDPLQLSVRQQRDILQDCEIFLTEAGSALANMVFLPAGAKVITLATKLAFKDYFCSIAASLGIEMHVVLSDMKAIYPRHQFLWSAFTPALDLSAVTRCLEAVTAARLLGREAA